jgi:hypothetical protein
VEHRFHARLQVQPCLRDKAYVFFCLAQQPNLLAAGYNWLAEEFARGDISAREAGLGL